MNIVITGGTSGLGKALVEKFKAKGDRVFVLARSAEGEDCIKCDVGKKESVVSAFEEIKTKVDNIDILINNAGLGVFGATELISQEEVENIFNVVFFGTLYASQCALQFMKSGSKIINISSACALFALPYRSLYCASKSAVSMLSFSLRMELENAKIQVSAICPGNIKTNFTKNRVKNFATNEHYGDSIQKANERINKEENDRMTLESASAKIFKIINKKRLKPQYIIGGKYKFLYFASKFVPLSWLLKATNSVTKK